MYKDNGSSAYFNLKFVCDDFCEEINAAKQPDFPEEAELKSTCIFQCYNAVHLFALYQL